MKIIIYGTKYGIAKEYACELSRRVNIDIMRLLYEKAKRIPVENRNSETEAMISTYNKKISFVDYFGLNDIINEINKYS